MIYSETQRQSEERKKNRQKQIKFKNRKRDDKKLKLKRKLKNLEKTLATQSLSHKKSENKWARKIKNIKLKNQNLKCNEERCRNNNPENANLCEENINGKIIGVETENEIKKM